MRITANQEMKQFSLLLRFLLQLGGQSDTAQGQVTKVIQSQQAHRQHVFRYNFSELCFGDDLNSVQLEAMENLELVSDILITCFLENL